MGQLNPSSPMGQLLSGLVRAGSVVWIGIRPQRRGQLQSVLEAQLEAGAGVVGDHYRNAGGARQVTLIPAENLEAIASYLGVERVDPAALRRNIVTRGINLLALKGRRFRIGDAVLEASGECHPCSRMEENLGAGGYNAVRGLGGITARVVQTGRIRVNDAICAIPPNGQDVQVGLKDDPM